MNLLLFSADEIGASGELTVEDRRHQHLVHVLGAKTGDTIRVGQIEGAVGSGFLTRIDDRSATLSVDLNREAPKPLDLTVVLALPRPKMLRRILRGLAEVGVKDIYLINSFKVEKSYWQSPLLDRAEYEAWLLAGLEQAMDTRMPAVTLSQRFRPFAEDVLPRLCAGREALLADHRAAEPYPSAPQIPGVLVIGPEGGFTEFECELIGNAGAKAVTMGDRVLRVETALHCALGRHLGPG
ncbi:MAG: 16S rRNA (uracil(1498)-N(3))-methyltransferase [Pseudomonadota bacterium]